jgi:hypothetical protein
MKSVRPCVYSYDLDLSTLVWTRGAPFPLSDLASRLKCPSCGSRRVALIFHMPREPQVQKSNRTAWLPEPALNYGHGGDHRSDGRNCRETEHPSSEA